MSFPDTLKTACLSELSLKRLFLLFILINEEFY